MTFCFQTVSLHHTVTSWGAENKIRRLSVLGIYGSTYKKHVQQSFKQARDEMVDAMSLSSNMDDLKQNLKRAIESTDDCTVKFMVIELVEASADTCNTITCQIVI